MSVSHNIASANIFDSTEGGRDILTDSSVGNRLIKRQSSAFDVQPPPFDPAAWNDDETVVFSHRDIPGTNRVGPIQILRHGDRWVMVWASFESGSGINSWISFSQDLRNWYGHTRILGPAIGGWEGPRNLPEALIYDPTLEKWVLFYGGAGLDTISQGLRGFGYATADKITGPYTRNVNNPVGTITQIDVSWAPQPADALYMQGCVLIDGVYHAVINAGIRSTSDYSAGIFTATSPDGPWTSSDGNPLWPGIDADWPDGSTPGFPWYSDAAGRWYMPFFDGGNGRLGFAHSANEKIDSSWTRSDAVSITPINGGAGMNATIVPVGGEAWYCFVSVSEDAGEAGSVNSQVRLITSGDVPGRDSIPPVDALLSDNNAVGQALEKLATGVSSTIPDLPNKIWSRDNSILITRPIDFVAVKDGLVAAWIPWITGDSTDVVGDNNATAASIVDDGGVSVFQFTGGDDKITAGAVPGVTDAITYICRYKRTSGAGRQYFLYTDSVQASTNIAYLDSPGLGVGDEAVNDQWRHIAITYDGAIIRVYIDGAEVSNRAKTGALPEITNVTIGSHDVGQGMVGNIAEVRIYDRALMPAEVTETYDNFDDVSETVADRLNKADETSISFVVESGTSRTLGIGDSKKYIRCTSNDPVSITVAPQSDASWATGTHITLIPAGEGQITVVAGAGVTINTPDTLRSAKRYAPMTLVRTETPDVWDLAGYLEVA